VSYFEIGVFSPKTETNIGTLWRSAYQLGAAGIFTIGRRYNRQASDTLKSERHIPLRNYLEFHELLSTRPMGAILVGVEIGGTPLSKFKHPKQAIYLLGAEDNGLPPCLVNAMNEVISIESITRPSYNVAVAGSIVMYHRLISS